MMNTPARDAKALTTRIGRTYRFESAHHLPIYYVILCAAWRVRALFG